MDDLIALGIHNAVVAIVLAILVMVVTHFWRSPPLAHMLWVLVLVKLISPPIIHWTLPIPMLSGPSLAPATSAYEAPVGHSVALGSGGVVAGPLEATASPAIVPAWVCTLLLGVWLCGAVAVFTVVVIRAIRFERKLRSTLPASERIRAVSSTLKTKMGMRRVPDVRCAAGVSVPFVWCFCHRPTIVLPLALVQTLNDEQIEMIIVHELAHVRRRDHWIRIVEIVVLVFYWWNPFLKFVRNRLHQAEDLCCDAWVRWTLPESRQSYAELLLAIAESLGESTKQEKLLPSSPLLEQLTYLRSLVSAVQEYGFDVVDCDF